MNRLTCLLTTGACLLASLMSHAQKDSTLSQKIGTAFCTAFSKKDFTMDKNFEVEVGLLILPVIERYSKEIKEEWNLDAADIGDFEKIGEKVGQEAAINCPKFREFVQNNLSEIANMTDDNLKTISGMFQRIDDQQFSSVVIKTKSGKEERLWWFEFFEGSDGLLKKPASFAKKNLTIRYTTMDVYDPKLKEYRTIKVIKSLSAE